MLPAGERPECTNWQLALLASGCTESLAADRKLLDIMISTKVFPTSFSDPSEIDRMGISSSKLFLSSQQLHRMIIRFGMDFMNLISFMSQLRDSGFDRRNVPIVAGDSHGAKKHRFYSTLCPSIPLS
jgi:hypothetical protein